MKQGSNNKRPRRGGAPKGNRGSVRNQTFDSNCGGHRVRGTAQQVMEKYLAMARDAASSGDRILAENFYQHAEHYFRIANVNGALSSRIQQQQSNGANMSLTPAYDQTLLDDLFDYEEEAALQHQSGHGQQRERGGDQRRDSDRNPDQQPRHQPHEAEGGSSQAARDEQPAPQQPVQADAVSDTDQPQDQGDDRPARPRRARTRRKPVEGADAAPDSEAAPAVQPVAADDEPAAKPPRTRRTRKTADKEAEASGAEEGGEAPAPRRRRAPARKKAASTSDSGDESGDGDRREAVA